MPPITLYNLQASRSIRIAWLLEELGLDYTLELANRQSDSKAPQWFKDKSGNPLGKFPTLKDGSRRPSKSPNNDDSADDGDNDDELIIYESGAIVEYLLERYDTEKKYLPSDARERIMARTWLHASEGTFMVHALSLVYAQWFMPDAKGGNQGLLEETQKGMAVNVQKDLDWLEGELAKGEETEGQGRKWLVGNRLTVADIMMVFSVDYILVKGLAKPEKGQEWKRTEKWLKTCKREEGFQKALKKTGYQL